MKFQLRLFLTTLAMAVPIIFGVLFVFNRTITRVADNITSSFIRAQFPINTPGACAEEWAKSEHRLSLPLGFGGLHAEPAHPIPVQVFFFDPQGKSLAKMAPALPEELRFQKRSHQEDPGGKR